MNDNNIKINIPKGKVIDIENSNFEKGIITFRPKFITYEEIFNEVIAQSNNDRRSKDLAKARAFNKLINIARFYNGPGWRPNWYNINESKYYIHYDNSAKKYKIGSQPYATNDIGTVYFKCVNDAVSVTNNPNLIPILDAIFKD